MLRPRISRLSVTNDDTSVSAVERFRNEADSSSRSPSSSPETSASDWLKSRTVLSFSASVSMNLPSCSALPNSSSLLSARVSVSRAKFLIVELTLAPCPPKLSAATASRSDRAPFSFGAVGTERHVEGVEALEDLVELERHGGPVSGELGVVGHHLVALLEHRRELDEPVTDDRRRHDRGLGVGGEVDVGVVGHRHLDVGARRRDLVDRADRHPEHAHLAALVDARRCAGSAPRDACESSPPSIGQHRRR